MQAVENETEAIQISLSKQQADELRSLAKQMERPIDAFIADLLVIYKSERIKREWALERFGQVVERIQQQSILNGTSEMTMEEIDEEIAAARREAALAKTA